MHVYTAYPLFIKTIWLSPSSVYARFSERGEVPPDEHTLAKFLTAQLALSIT